MLSINLKFAASGRYRERHLQFLAVKFPLLETYNLAVTYPRQL